MSIDPNSLITLLNVADISSSMHYYGINVRHLGLVRKNLTKPAFRDFLLLQIISRVMKNILRSDMRSLRSNSLGSPTDMPLRNLVLQTYKKIHPYRHDIKDDKLKVLVKEYWAKVFSETLDQYEDCFSAEEIEEILTTSLHDFVRARLDFRALLYLFFKFGQIQISDNAMKQMLTPTMKDGVCLKQNFRLVVLD